MKTSKQVNELIDQANDPKWFKSIETSFKSAIIDAHVEFNNFQSLYQFIARQVRGWKKLETIPGELQNSKNYFHELNADLDYILDKSAEENNSEMMRRWQNVNQKLQNSARSNLLTYEAPMTSFLIEAFKKHPEYYSAAYEFLLTGQTRNFQHANYFTGYMLAFEFKMKDETSVFSRAKKEKSANARVRNDLEKTFIETESHFSEIVEKMREEAKNYLRHTAREKNKSIETYDNWFIQTKEDFNQFYDNAAEKRKDVETTYSNLLSLKQPAQYWGDRAKALKESGNKWMGWLIASLITGILVLLTVLHFLTDAKFEEIFSSVGSGIRWSIVLIAMISLIAFAIKTFAKLTFSTFHLVRDAEERKQLTYVYLALLNDKAVEEKDRHLVLQSLFSRSDSGLLREDSSPTMPGGILNKLVDKSS